MLCYVGSWGFLNITLLVIYLTIKSLGDFIEELILLVVMTLICISS